MIQAKNYLNTTPSIYGKMSLMSIQHGAVNFTQGAPDFDTPSWLIDRVDFYMNQGKNQYSPTIGVEALRKAIVQKQKRCYDVDVDLAEVTITTGAVEGLFAVISAYVGKDDEVIFFDPAFDAYIEIVRLNQAKCVRLNLLANGHIDLHAIANAITPKTKMIIINSPHNPIGSVVTKEEYQELAKIIKGKDILLIADEVYEHIYAGESFISAIQVPELRNQLVILQSLGKTYNLTGWRMGVLIAAPEVVKHVSAVRQLTTFCSPTPFQLGLADVIIEHPEYYEGLHLQYKKQYELLLSYLNKSRFKVLPWEGSPFVNLDYSAISSESDMDFCVRAIHEYGVGLVPLSSLYEKVPERSLLRLCFAKKDNVIISGAEKLCQI